MRRSLVVAVVTACALALGFAPQAANAAPARTAVVVTSTGARSIQVGQLYVVSGRASGNLVGRRIYLQRRVGRTWTTLGSTVINSRRLFTLRVRSTQAGRGQAMRTYVPATYRTRGAAAYPGYFSVFAWYYLSSTERLEPVEDYWDDEGPLGIDGTSYSRSVSIDPSGDGDPESVQVNLSRKCTQFTAAVGLTDDSSSQAVFTGEVDGDDLALWSAGNLRIAQHSVVTVNVSGALRLRVTASRQDQTYEDGSLGLGNARVLCAF